MSLTVEEVDKIAHLARLGLSECEARGMAAELSRILDFVAEMERVDTSAVEPMAHPLDMAQRLRADAVSEADRHDVFQAAAPLVEAGLYLVPKVIE